MNMLTPALRKWGPMFIFMCVLAGVILALSPELRSEIIKYTVF
jgi:cbb3-type cytochrome oxidase subunit 3